MEILIVTRHPGAIAFINSRGFVGEQCEHFVPEMVHSGMVVVGILPVHLISHVLERGGRFIQVILPDIPPDMRGVELTPEQMVNFGADMMEITGISTRRV